MTPVAHWSVAEQEVYRGLDLSDKKSGHAFSMDAQTQISPVQEIVTAPKRAAIYQRVSTDRQASKVDAAEGYSIPQQRGYCYHKSTRTGCGGRGGVR